MKRIAFLLVLGAGIFWGVIGIFVRHFESLGLSSFELTLVRTFCSAIIFTVFLFFYNRKLFRIRLRDIWIFLGTGLISVAVFSYAYFKAMELMSLSVAAVLLYTAPTFVMIFSIILFKEKITLQKIIALVLSFMGCMFVTGVMTGNIQITLQGFLFGILSGICYALYSIFSRFALERDYDPLTILIYTFLIAGIFMLFVSRPLTVIEIAVKDPVEIIWIIGFVFCSEIIPYVLYTTGLKYIKSSTASIIVSIEPVVATIVSALVFKEEILFPWGYVGILLVIISIVVANISETGKEKNRLRFLKHKGD